MLLHIELMFCVEGKRRLAAAVVAKQIWSCLIMAETLLPSTIVSSVV
jgi:hypothetical protein